MTETDEVEDLRDEDDVVLEDLDELDEGRIVLMRDEDVVPEHMPYLL